MPRPPSEIIVNAEPVEESIYAPGPHSDLETPIYIADLRPDMNRGSGPGNIQNLRYNKVEDSYHEPRRRDDNECDDCGCCESDTLCIICFCCCLCD